MIAIQDPLNQLPPQASTFAPSVDGLYYFTFWVMAFFFFLLCGLLGFAIIKWRRRTPDQPAASNITHHTALEVTWTVVPLIIVMVIFAWGLRDFMDMTIAPANSLQYTVTGKQWSWHIQHPGTQRAETNQIMVPIDTPVRFIMSSQDVLHSFFVPAMRVKRDVLPGRYQMVWFKPTMLGTFDLFCAEYCGTGHSQMVGKVHVVSKQEFEEKRATGGYFKLEGTPEEIGAQLALQNGCTVCHNTTGAPGGIGPTWKGIWGRTEEMTSGEKVTIEGDAGRQYIIESIHDPAKRVVKPYTPTMTPFPHLTEEEIDAIIAYMKTLK